MVTKSILNYAGCQTLNSNQQKTTDLIRQSTLNYDPIENTMTRWLMLTGALLFALGALLHFAPGSLNWFRKLPGDIRIESEHGQIFVPLTSMLIISIAITLLINIFKR